MRKVLCFILASVMTMCCFSALAEAAETEKLNTVVITPDGTDDFSEITKKLGTDSITVPDRPSAIDSYTKDIQEETEENVTKAATKDTVVINGNTYTVMLGNAMTFHYVAPSNVIVLTQDLAQQSALYAQIYKNPKQVVDSFIQEGMHLNLFDKNTNADAYFYVYASDTAKVFPNANVLTEEEAVYIIKYFFSLDDYFGHCKEATYGYAGGNVWLIGDARSTVERIFLCTFVNGLEVWGVVPAKTDAQYNAVVDMLNYLSIN